MLRYLAEWLTHYYTGFNAFSYLTLRAILAGERTEFDLSLLSPDRYA